MAIKACASNCVHHPPQALPHVKLLWAFVYEKLYVGHPFVGIKHSFWLLCNYLNKYKTQSMVKHDLCQDPNLFSFITNKIDCLLNFYKAITYSLSNKNYGSLHAYNLQKTSRWTMNPNIFLNHLPFTPIKSYQVLLFHNLRPH